jgi:hypothetical protein
VTSVSFDRAIGQHQSAPLSAHDHPVNRFEENPVGIGS